MPRYFNVNGHAYVSITARVEVSDEVIQEVADLHEVSVDEVTVEHLDDHIREVWQDDIPSSLCVHCSGMVMGSAHSMELDGEWTLDDEDWDRHRGEKPKVIHEIDETEYRGRY